MTDRRLIYFVGAGGIGMAALERYFLSRGYQVSGYDLTPTSLTDTLITEGVDMSFEDSVDTIPSQFKANPSDTLVVYTPAIPEDNAILRYFSDNGYVVMKRAAILGLITKSLKGICFAGTHGKTTTSSMAAHILNQCRVGCNAFLGGILRNYGSNLLLSSTSPYAVIEADEYDRSFHHLSPYIAVITSTDPDHLDIYGSEEAYLESFAYFTELISPEGALVIHEGLKLTPRPAQGVKVYTYSRDRGDFHARNIRRGNGTIMFDMVTPEGVFQNIELGVPVEINIENAIAAIAACCLTGEMEVEAMRKAMTSFMGPKRRFEFWLKNTDHVVIDDYAHHPDELKASIASVRALYPDQRLTVAFQPHLYSRTHDFANQFAEALSMADCVILLNIYPAREEPIPGVSSQIVFDNIKIEDKVLVDKTQLVETLKKRKIELLLTVGAGDICNYLPEIVKSLVDGE